MFCAPTGKATLSSDGRGWSWAPRVEPGSTPKRAAPQPQRGAVAPHRGAAAPRGGAVAPRRSPAPLWAPQGHIWTACHVDEVGLIRVCRIYWPEGPSTSRNNTFLTHLWAWRERQTNPAQPLQALKAQLYPIYSGQCDSRPRRAAAPTEIRAEEFTCAAVLCLGARQHGVGPPCALRILVR